MNRDPIVEEVRRIREQLWDECGGDLHRFMERIRSAEAEHPDRVVTTESLRALRQRQSGQVRTDKSQSDHSHSTN